MVRHTLDRGCEVVGVCREKSVEKLNAFKDRITLSKVVILMLTQELN